MKKLLLRLLLGAEDITSLALTMITLRRKALAQHAANKDLAVKLKTGIEELAALTTSYNWARSAMEKAYTLELD